MIECGAGCADQTPKWSISFLFSFTAPNVQIHFRPLSNFSSPSRWLILANNLYWFLPPNPTRFFPPVSFPLKGTGKVVGYLSIFHIFQSRLIFFFPHALHFRFNWHSIRSQWGFLWDFYFCGPMIRQFSVSFVGVSWLEVSKSSEPFLLTHSIVEPVLMIWFIFFNYFSN